MQTLRHEFWVAGAIVLLLAALSGCGKAEHASNTAAPGRPATRKAAPDAAELALANMVSAVSSGKAGDFELKYELRERPVVGQPVDIDLALIPARDMDRIYAVFQAADGLELTKGGRTSDFDHPPAGVPITHTLTVVAQRDGVLYVSAVVLADTSTESVTRSFSIPVIAGAGFSAPAAAEPPEPSTAPPSAQGH